MHEDGSIDYDDRCQVQRMLDGGVQALLVNGTTGEMQRFIDDELKLLDIKQRWQRNWCKVIAEYQMTPQ
ncbi:MAG: hypothetical protein ACLRQF_14105 [Thomasclavelia ramosa]